MTSASLADEPARWRAAGRALVAKMLAELAFEEVLAPAPGDGPRDWSVTLGSGAEYRFRAGRGAFGAWRVEEGSVVRAADGRAEAAEDPLRLALDARGDLGLSGPDTAEVVRELTSTQAADARLLAAGLSAAELADLSHVELESQGAGHPCIILNKGRMGFSAADAGRYAPEAAQPLRLRWIAVHPDLAQTAGVAGLDHDALLARELGEDERRRLGAPLAGRPGAEAYRWLPVHPFHWDEAVAPLFAGEIAQGRMVPLGEGSDRYRPLQSVRTLTNVDAPDRHDVKTTLLVRNTLVWRGLDRRATAAAPAITTWLLGVRESDPHLRDECRIALLGEVASVAVGHPVLDAIPDAPYRYHELLGAVWRQPVASWLEPGERARTMAALLTVGSDGRALVAELVARSGLPADEWLRRLLAALLRPLLHYLVRYGVAFCPHGENTVVIYDERDVPVRIAIKDFAEDVNLLPGARPEYADLPPAADEVLLRWEPRQLRHSILSAVFVGHFRFMTDLLERHLGVAEEAFWAMVREELAAYPARFPELAGRFAEYELTAPAFERVCLNREHLLGGEFHDRSERDADFDVMHGRVPSPLAA